MRISTLALATLMLGNTGCFGNRVDEFPPGIEPWEENLASLPEPDDTSVCPEQNIAFARSAYMGARSVHGKTCIHQPIAVVWEAARDPQASRDASHGGRFRVTEYETNPDYDYSYNTYIFVSDIVDIEYDLEWRHELVEGTDEAPLLTATRWQKINGTTAISVMEGSLVLRPHPDDAGITIAEYQYHLGAVGQGHSTGEGFVQQIANRLRDRSHDRPLDPDDCIDCATPPPGY